MILLQQDFHSFPTPVSGSDNGDYLKRNTLIPFLLLKLIHYSYSYKSINTYGLVMTLLS